MDDKTTGFNEQPETAGNDEAGKTYWEIGAGAETGLDHKAGRYSGYQTHMNEGTETVLTQYEGSKKPTGRKPILRLVAVIIAIALLCIGGITAFAFHNEIMNSIAMMTKSPGEYYKYVEGKNFVDHAGDVSSFVKDCAKIFETDHRYTMELSYDKNTVSSFIKPYTGTSISDVEDILGLPLDSIGMDMIAANEDSESYNEIVLKLNQTGLLTAQIFRDKVNNEILLGLPDLTDAYLKIADNYTSKNQAGILAPERTEDFIKCYSSVITNKIKDMQVELKKGTELNVGKASVNSTLITVTIDYNDLVQIMDAILSEANDDELLPDLFSLYGKTKDDYRKALEDFRKSINDRANQAGIGYEDKKIIMKVHVDNKGNIIGREFEAYIQDSLESKLGYFRIDKAKNNYYEFYCEDNEGNKLLSVEGSHVKSDNAYSGSTDISLYDNEEGNISISLEYEDVKREKKGDATFVYGTFSLITPKLPGSEILLKLDAEDEVQKADLFFKMGSTSLVTLSFTAQRLNDYDLPHPNSSAAVYGINDSESYTATFDTYGYINNLSEKLGVDILYIMDLFNGFGNIDDIF